MVGQADEQQPFRHLQLFRQRHDVLVQPAVADDDEARSRALLQVERRELDPQLRPFVRFQAEHAADGFRGIGRVFLERPPFVLVRGGGVGGKIRHAVVQHMEAHDGNAEPFRIGFGRLAAVADEVHAGHLGQGLVQLGILFAEAILADVRRQAAEHQVDGGRARQQRCQRAEQAGAVLPQADHVERVRPQHRRQPRHAVVHRRRQLFQQPAQAALRHGLMGHRDRRQLVDFRDRDLRLDQHGQEEVQALLLGRARRLGVLLDQHFDFSGFGSRSRDACPGCSARRVSSPASRVSWRSAPPGPRLPVTSATETGFSGPCSGRCRSRKCRIACFIDTIRMSLPTSADSGSRR